MNKFEARSGVKLHQIQINTCDWSELLGCRNQKVTSDSDLFIMWISLLQLVNLLMHLWPICGRDQCHKNASSNIVFRLNLLYLSQVWISGGLPSYKQLCSHLCHCLPILSLVYMPWGAVYSCSNKSDADRPSPWDCLVICTLNSNNCLDQGFSTFFHRRTPGVYMIHDTYPQAEKNILFANITLHCHYI